MTDTKCTPPRPATDPPTVARRLTRAILRWIAATTRAVVQTQSRLDTLGTRF